MLVLYIVDYVLTIHGIRNCDITKTPLTYSIFFTLV